VLAFVSSNSLRERGGKVPVVSRRGKSFWNVELKNGQEKSRKKGVTMVPARKTQRGTPVGESSSHEKSQQTKGGREPTGGKNKEEQKARLLSRNDNVGGGNERMCSEAVQARNEGQGENTRLQILHDKDQGKRRNEESRGKAARKEKGQINRTSPKRKRT